MKKRMPGWLLPWIHWRYKRFWALAVVLAWILFGFFGAPPLLERGLSQTFEETGRGIDIADIHINPFPLSLRINDLVIRDPDETPIIRFDELYVNFQASSLFRWAWTFKEIRLVGLHLEEERFAEGETRMARLGADFEEAPESSETETEPAGLTRVVIHSLVLEGGSIGLTDHLAGGFQAEFSPVSVTANDLRTMPEHAGEMQVSIVTPSGGVVSWRGDLQLVPLASSGHFSVRGKGLPAALRYADHFLPVEIEGEELSVNFDYSLRAQAGALSLGISNASTQTGSILVRMDGEEEAFLDLEGITLAGGNLRLPEREVSAESLAGEGLELDTWLDEQGRLNLLDALHPEGAEDAKEASTAPRPPPWDVSLGTITLTGAAVNFEDRQLTSPGSIRLEDMTLSLRAFDTEQGTEMPLELSTRLAAGGDLSYRGNVVVLPTFRLDGRASASDLALSALQPWLTEHARVELISGTARMEADLSGELPESLVLTGDAGVSGLELQDTLRDQRLAALKTMHIERIELNLPEMSLRTSPISLRGAYGHVHIYEDLSTNFDGLAIEKEAQAGAEEPGDMDLTITIAGIDVEDGALDFADDSLPLPFETAIRSLVGNLSTLATQSEEPTAVNLEGQVDEFGEARIHGSINPWDFTQSADIDMAFRNLQMSNLTPYTIQYAGYAIEGGRLDMDLGYTIKQRELKGDNNIVIRELVLGDKVEHPEAGSLPLKLAVALLKDADGVIDIDLPVSGDMDDPTFKISGIIWKAIGNLIMNVVTSPFRFLGGLVGVDSEDLGTLSFRPGRADVLPQDREQLMKLAEAMRTRPELSLVVTGTYVEALDRPAIKQQAFEARFEARRAKLLESGEVEALGADLPAMESLFAEVFPAVPLESLQGEFMGLPLSETDEAPQEDVLDEPAYLAELRRRLVEAEEIEEERLRSLAAERAVEVFRALQANAGKATLAVTVANEVEAGEAREGMIRLELEVAVREEQAPSE